MGTVELTTIVTQEIRDIEQQLIGACYQGANDMRNQALKTLRGQRHGRRYRVPNTRRYYTASAPGEPPAVRTGVFRTSWRPTVYVSSQGNGFEAIAKIESTLRTDQGQNLAELLESGSSKMAPRPYQEEIADAAEEKFLKRIERIGR